MALRKGLFVIERQSFDMVFGPDEISALSRHVEWVAPPQTKDSIAAHPKVLADVELIVGGWGMPRLDAQLLRSAPRLSAVFYAGGATGSWMTDAAWDRGIVVTTASDANAIPVAEYTLATILFSLKHGWSLARQTLRERTFPDRNGAPGAFGSIVGLVSLGAIGRRVAQFLAPLSVKVLAYDPYVTDDDAAEMGVELVTLEDLFARCDVVSLHTPELPETIGMIAGRHISKMKKGATLINSSRGALINEEEMLDELERRPDLHAVLDTLIVEPPPKQSRVYTLENVTLTPHIAGSVGNECRRMSQYMVEELERYVHGRPLKWQLRRETVLRSVHRPLIAPPAVSVEMGAVIKRLGADGTKEVVVN